MSAAGVFRQSVVVADDAIDGLGHASNIVYVRWIQDVAVAHSAALGWDDAAYRRVGGVFVVRRHEIDYLRPVLAGDTLTLETWVESWRAASSLRRTRIVRGDVECARAATTWAFVGLDDGRPRRIEPQLRSDFDRAGEGA